MLHALRTWWQRPCVVQDLRQALCRHCFHVENLVAHFGRCCWCGVRDGDRHGPYAEG